MLVSLFATLILVAVVATILPANTAVVNAQIVEQYLAEVLYITAIIVQAHATTVIKATMERL